MDLDHGLDDDVLACDATGCDESAVTGEIGEGGDVLLCARHSVGAS